VADNSPRVLGGRYEVGELIGRGGMAEVHIGHDTRLGRTVAIKILRSDLARDPAFQARFQREAQSAASLNYPAIVAVYDSGEDTYSDPTTGEVVHVPYIVMEYVEGHTVREILNHGDAVPIDEAVEITSGVLSALDYSHHAGIIHRDIKPGNVMITPTGSVKVMDFGIARAVADSAATMTQTQAVIGTAQYLSPEQARGETVDARSDIYSTGCLLFELLTGRPPFVGDSPVAVAYQHVGQAPLAPSDLAADVPPELDRITLKALAKERSQRYSSAAEFKADLDAFLTGQSLAATSVAHPVIHPGGPTVGATQVFHPGVPATQVFRPGVAETQHLGAAAAGAVGATTVFHGTGFPGKSGMPHATVPPVAEAVLPGSVPPAPQWGSVAPAPLTPAQGLAQIPEEEPHRSKVWLWILLPLLIIGVGLAAFFLTRGSGGGEDEIPETAMVPTFTEGISEAQACEQLRLAGFLCDPLPDGNSNLPAGTFIRQDPLGGTQLEVGQAVTLWFSAGPSTIPVPGLEGMTLEQATARLQEVGLEIGEVNQESDPQLPAGHVIRTQPARDFAVNRGDRINVYISSGLVTLPNLTGQTQDQAIARLNELGLQHRIEPQPTAAQPAGTVLSTSPSAGDVDQGMTIILNVAVAPEIEMRAVPGVRGKTCQEASGTLVGAGFQPTTDNQASQQYLPGITIDTRPGEGTEAQVGSTVTIVCSLGPGPAPTPTPTDTPTSPPPDGGGDGGGDQGGDQGGGDQGGQEGRTNLGADRRGFLRDVDPGEMELDGPDDGTTLP